MARPDAEVGRAKLGRRGRIGVAREVLGTALQAALLFGSAGRLDWPNAWIYLALVTASQAGLTLLLTRRDPALLEARGGVQPGARRWDLALVITAFLLGYVALVAAGLDAGRSPTASMPAWLSGVGAAGFVAAAGLISWAMAENTHFEGLVRIQSERGHSVCTSGPYAIVRHPGYLGMIIAILGTPLILGSWWALIPSAASAALFLLRTVLEDRTLQRELAGYADYASVTRARLIPRVW